MSKFEKLKTRLLSYPNDFSFDELQALLTGLGYERSNKGKTSGSRVAFVNFASGHIIRIHKPHPKNILKQYVIKYLVDELKEKNLL